jgi:pimeloyl-ACP methyl ester carboxylesterase
LFHSSALEDNEEKKATRQKNIDFISKHGTAKYIEQSVPTLFSEKTRTENPALVDSMIRKYSGLTATSLIDYTKAMIRRPERVDVLKSIQRPVMFLLGEWDNAVPLEAGLKQSHIPGISYIYICTNSGHLGMLEEPEFCVKSILDFLSSP